MRSICAFVHGEPRPWPKKEIKMVPIPGTRPQRFKPITYIRDKDGSKKEWMDTVKLIATKTAKAIAWEVLPRDVPLKIIVRVYRTKAKSNKHKHPVTNPDGDNFFYLIHNVLEGIWYEDDSQICVYEESKKWADLTGYRPNAMPGVYIEIQEIDRPKLLKLLEEEKAFFAAAKVYKRARGGDNIELANAATELFSARDKLQSAIADAEKEE